MSIREFNTPKGFLGSVLSLPILIFILLFETIRCPNKTSNVVVQKNEDGSRKFIFS